MTYLSGLFLCPLIRLVPRTATHGFCARAPARPPCPLIRLVPRTATPPATSADVQSHVSVDQVGSKDSDFFSFLFWASCPVCPLIRLVPRTATYMGVGNISTKEGCPLIRLVPRTATKTSLAACAISLLCPLIRLVPRTATRVAPLSRARDIVSVDQVGSKDSDYPKNGNIPQYVGVR